jgi:hypothetical protein
MCDKYTGTQSQCGSTVKGSEGDAEAPETRTDVSEGLDRVQLTVRVHTCRYRRLSRVRRAYHMGIEVGNSVSKGVDND